MSEWTSHVLPHGELKQIADGLWLVTGSLPHGKLPRNMVVYRLPNSDLIVHSVIALDDNGMKYLESLGELKYMIVPNRFHRLDAAVYKSRYPQLKVLCPAAARAAVQAKVEVDGTCEDILPPLGVKCLLPDGIKPGELIYEVPLSSGRALVSTDILFNLANASGFQGWCLKMLGSSGFFGMTRIGRLLMLRDRAAFRSWLDTQASTLGLQAIIVGHGDPILKDCAIQLKNAAAKL